jgi:hypothetical protein
MAIRLKHWLSQLCTWHEQYRKGELDAEFLAPYTEARADLSATLVLAQRIEICAGGVRQALRVARAIPVEFDLPAGKTSALTQDISVSGLSALVGETAVVGTQLSFRLKLGRDVEAIAGRCRVVAVIPVEGSARMAVTFDEITNEARLRIENLVFDAICAEIRTLLLHSGQQVGSSPSKPGTPGTLVERCTAMAQEAATGEIPIGSDEPEAGKDEDVFEEIPTVANQANPTSTAGAGGETASSTSAPSEGAGAYRIVCPTTSDLVDAPAAPKIDPSTSRRLIIGSAGKPR